MKIVVIEYDTYYIGLATWCESSEMCIEYAMEIHLLFLDNKSLYLFFKKSTYVLSKENVSDIHIQLKIASEFERLDIPSNVKIYTYHVFVFDPNDENFGIDARMNIQITEKSEMDLKKRISDLSNCFLARIVCGFDVLKSES